MRRYVLDASALLRLYVPDGPLPEEAEEALVSAGRGEAVLLLPELALAEAGQVLWKKERRGFLLADEADEILQAILALPVDLAPHAALLPGALALARRWKLTVYDALYLALAVRTRASLVTADRELARVAADVLP